MSEIFKASDVRLIAIPVLFSMNTYMRGPRIANTLGIFAAALLSSGCGGASHSITPTASPAKGPVPVGSPIQLNAKDQVTAIQKINGQIYVCGLFDGRAGVDVDGTVKLCPLAVLGIHLMLPYFVAGNTLYGYGQAVTMQQQAEGFQYGLDLGVASGTRYGMPSAISQDNTKVGFTASVDSYPFSTGSIVWIMDAKTGNAVQVAADSSLQPTVLAVSDTGGGVVQMSKSKTDLTRSIFRFQPEGTILPLPLAGTAAYPVPLPSRMAPDGTVIGAVTTSYGQGAPTYAAIWRPGSEIPTLLGLPPKTVSSSATCITSGNLVTGVADSRAVMWPNALIKPKVVVDLNKTLPKPAGATITNVAALQSNPLSFVVQLAVGKNGPTIQVYSAN